jgi:protein-tyrosine phosphatase
METNKINTFCNLCEFSKFQGIVFCKWCFKNRKIDPTLYEIDQITNKIYLGNEEAAKNFEMLTKLEITHILICGVDLVKFFPEKFVYHMVELEDHPNENILKLLSKCLKFIQSGKKVFVHCWAGVSRSASIVIAYLIWSKKISFDQAYEEVKSKRECINPNEGFIYQLKQFSEKLKKNNFKIPKFE